VKKSDVGWLVEPGMREIPRKAIEEAKELLAQGKEYARHVIRAWLERKAVRWNGYLFQPRIFGVEVYFDGKYERAWKNRAVEIVFHKVVLEDEKIIEEPVRVRAPATKTKVERDDEDQIGVDVSIELPSRTRNFSLALGRTNANESL
jgi:hypothetical protein